MKLGTFEIPEFRLVPNCIDNIKKVYDTVKLETITSKDLAPLLGYKAPTSGRFYVKLHSLVTYGLIKTGNNVTELGYEIAYPESPDHEDTVRKKAIFTVRLWKELYDRVGTTPPSDFWIPLGNITKVDRPTAQKYSSLIKKWYMEDISLLPQQVLDNPLYDYTKKTKNIRSGVSLDNQMLQQIESPKLNNSSDIEILSFDKYQIALPKGDLKKEWNKLKKYMDIKLEDYEYKKTNVKFEDLDEKDQITKKENIVD